MRARKPSFHNRDGIQRTCLPITPTQAIAGVLMVAMIKFYLIVEGINKRTTMMMEGEVKLGQW